MTNLKIKTKALAFAKVMLAVVFLCGGCTNDNDFAKGKKQLEQQGYTDVKNTGYSAFCCDEKDTYSSGFTCKDKSGNVVKGCICSGIMKGITIRYE